MEFENKFKNAWSNLKDGEMQLVMEYSKRYMNYLDNGKTERECVLEAERIAKNNGYISIEEAKLKGQITKGDKIYAVSKDKTIAMFVIGEDKLEKGMRIIGSHVDAPRLDLKPIPVYEDEGMVLLKTHYYGGINKYQWTTIPLAMHGVVIKADGSKVNIVIGEDESDPVLYITDLLPHLGKEQREKTLGEGITGEHLTPILGHIPVEIEDNKFSVKQNILNILNEKYGIIEQDFISSELEIVPSGKSRDVGLDRGLIAAHGHDDRVCSYAAVEAIIETINPQKTAVALLVDKEEVNSNGNTSMNSKFFENIVAELILLEGDYCDLKVRKAMANSEVLSGDVCVAIDPNYPEVHEKMNAAKIGYGITITKYTGSKGKSGCNDANAEFVGKVRQIFNSNDVSWQVGELGKVDQGGGGTIAYILANYGAEVIDCGTSMLSMHAPIELVSKVDAYMTFKGYNAFFK